jgi:DNA-binding MarR family transcriptional regulator
MDSGRERSSVLTVIRLAKVVEIVLAEHGVTLNQFRMLTFVESGAPPLRELSVRLVMKPPNISAMVDGLVDRGLVRRGRRADDRRRFALSLTRSGARMVRLARRRCEDALAHVANTPGAPAGLLEALDGWVVGLDAAAVELRDGASPRVGLSRPE